MVTKENLPQNSEKVERPEAESMAVEPANPGAGRAAQPHRVHPQVRE